MVSDAELYLEYRKFYPNLSKAQAANLLAKQYDLSPDSVRGRLSRAENSPSVHAYLLRNFSLHSTSPSVATQREIIQRSEQDFAKSQQDGYKYTAVFVSDVHLPYVRHDALDLTLQIIEYLKPDYISAANDAIDNSSFGRHSDTRNISVKWAHAGDLGNLRTLEKHYYQSLTAAAPGSMLLSVTGNHDSWFFKWVREKSPETAEYNIADYMEWLYDECGVKQFSVGAENHIQFNTNLVWWHGQFVAQNPIGNAHNTLKQFVTDDGQLNSVIVGHTHRPVQIDGKLVGLPGVTFINSGCLSRLDPPYMKRAPRGWGLGIAVSTWTGGKAGAQSILIEYHKEGGVLVAEYKGREFRTPIDLSMPDER